MPAAAECPLDAWRQKMIVSSFRSLQIIVWVFSKVGEIAKHSVDEREGT